jgi:hypothetical protein
LRKRASKVDVRVACWNISEGNYKYQPADSQLPGIAQFIMESDPHVVRLNDLMIWRPWRHGGVHQPKRLQQLTGLPYAMWKNTVALGTNGV